MSNMANLQYSNGFGTYLSWPQGETYPYGNATEVSPNEMQNYYTAFKMTTPNKREKPSKSNQNQEIIFHDSTDVTHASIPTELVHPDSASHTIIEHLDLANFKSELCPNPHPHNHKQCPHYHNSKDRKRKGDYYTAELCRYAEVDDGQSCPNGDDCCKSHNRVEQLYRPEKYKTKFCSHYPNNLHQCEYGIFCSFAHSELDISIELIHNYEYDPDFYIFYYKTVHCPFNLTQHDKAQCVYAHNWQDFRRRPGKFTYEPSPCPNWKSTDYITNYSDGCPNGYNCQKCHGWKELEYHSLSFKTKPCTTKNCNRRTDCPFYHTPNERRMMSPNVTSKVFKYAPRNRIVENTFKRRQASTTQFPSQPMPPHTQSQQQQQHSQPHTHPNYTSNQMPETIKEHGKLTPPGLLPNSMKGTENVTTSPVFNNFPQPKHRSLEDFGEKRRSSCEDRTNFFAKQIAAPRKMSSGEEEVHKIKPINPVNPNGLLLFDQDILLKLLRKESEKQPEKPDFVHNYGTEDTSHNTMEESEKEKDTQSKMLFDIMEDVDALN